MARNISLAVFDEPEAGIDLWSFNNLIRIFENMRKADKNRTVVVISHQERLLKIADEIIVLSDGQLVKRGPSAEIMPEIMQSNYAQTICPKIED